MTPDEHAAAITEGWRSIEYAVTYTHIPGGPMLPGVHVPAVDFIRRAIADAIRAAEAEARADEREACARAALGALVGQGTDEQCRTLAMAAAAIRKRGEA